MTVGRNFNPEIGFLRRSDFSATSILGRFSPRLRRHPVVRRLTWSSELEYITDAARRTVEDRALSGAFGIELHNSDTLTFGVMRAYELLPVDFSIAANVMVPMGSYHANTLSGTYSLGGQRPISGSVSASHGTFYDGTRTTASYSGRIGVSPWFAMEPTLTLNWVSLPFGDFTARLVGSRVIVTPTARLGLSAFVQYNPTARTLTSSARMRWEYTPGSELFVVYSDGRSTGTAGYPGLLNRSFAVKATRLLRF